MCDKFHTHCSVYWGKVYIAKRDRTLSDSQAALKALSSNRIDFKLLCECLINLQELAEHNIVKLMWVPGHTGWKERNMLTDLLKLEQESHLLGQNQPGVFLWVKGSKRLKNGPENNVTFNWKDTPDHRNAKLLLKKPSHEIAADHLKLNRKRIKLLAELITGHCQLRKHLHTSYLNVKL